MTTVHWPDDTRIRERLIRSLANEFDVEYAAPEPGPTDTSDLAWLPLRGGRLLRNLQALRRSLLSEWDVLIVHDPELLPAAMIARIRRRPVVFDVHENFPAAAMTRAWVPRLLRGPMSAVTRLILRIAERSLVVTLAEEGYQSLFRGDHPVFPNYPDTSSYPDPAPGDGSIVYLGDVTIERGARVAVEATAQLSRRMLFVGRVTDQLKGRLQTLAGEESRTEFTGPLPNPEALEKVRTAGVAISPLLDTPNYRHSAPTKILEYLALGLPVVASDLPGTRRLVEGLEAVELVPPGDSNELAKAIDRSLDQTVRSRAAAQAPMVRERFCWAADAVTDFYCSLV